MDAIKGKWNSLIRWDDGQQRAFEEVKTAPCQDVVLHTLEFSMPFVLQVDALGQVVGAVLSQKVEGNE